MENNRNERDEKRRAVLKGSLSSLSNCAKSLSYAGQVRFYQELSDLLVSEGARKTKMPFLPGDTVYLPEGMSKCHGLEVRFTSLAVREEDGRIGVAVTLKQNRMGDTAFGTVPVEECLVLTDAAFGILLFGTKQEALDAAMRRTKTMESFH